MLKLVVDRWDSSRFKELGRGGEAVVYVMKPKGRQDLAAKVFLAPDAVEFKGNPALQEAARVRLTEMQTKLFDFPHGLPPEVVAPVAVLIDGQRRVFGYAMPLIKATSLDKLSRRTSDALTPTLAQAFLTKLHGVVAALHAKGVVIGDFNENNILVDAKTGTPTLIDADSMQFGVYQCKTFIPRFVAPELLQVVAPPTESARNGREAKGAEAPVFAMVAPHSQLTDWYSFLVIAMRVLTFTDPYGGVAGSMSLVERFADRITVFDKRVIYPRIARPLAEVPRPVLELFFRAFHLGERFIPDVKAFDSLTQPSAPAVVADASSSSDEKPKPKPRKKRRRKNVRSKPEQPRWGYQPDHWTDPW